MAVSETNVSLRIQRSFAHPRDQFFAAWTNPEVLSRWFAPTDDYTTVVRELDLRVGGRYAIEMRHVGGNVHTITGTYREVSPPSRLVFTWVWEDKPADGESVVTLELTETGIGCAMLLLHERIADTASRESHNQGWIGCLGRLEAKL